MKKKMRKLMPMVLVLLLALSVALAGCGAGSKEAYDSMASTVTTGSASNGSSNMKGEYDADMDYALEESATADMIDGGVSGEPGEANAALAQQKIILYLDYEIETLEFDKSVAALESLCSQLGGYIQDSYRSGDSINYDDLHRANYTLRIPSDRLDDFKLGAEGIGTVTSISTSSENITERYYDIESRLASLRTQEERLLALMEKSETLTDVIELEQALAEVTYEIESLTGSLRRYDSLVEYSTVTVYLNEVVKYTEPVVVPRTLWDRMSSRFVNSIENIVDFGEELLVGLVGLLPVLVLLAVLFGIFFFPVRAILRRVSRKAKKPAAPAQPVQGWSYSQPEAPAEEKKPEE